MMGPLGGCGMMVAFGMNRKCCVPLCTSTHLFDTQVLDNILISTMTPAEIMRLAPFAREQHAGAANAHCETMQEVSSVSAILIEVEAKGGCPDTGGNC